MTFLLLSPSIQPLFQYISKRIDLSTNPQEPKKLLLTLPEDILIHIAEKLLPGSNSDNNWIENVKNFQYTCKTFFRIGFVIRNLFFFPFFNFKTENKSVANIKVVDVWFSNNKRKQNKKICLQLDTLMMLHYVKPFDIYSTFLFLQYGHKENLSLDMLVKLGALEEKDISEAEFSAVQEKYLSSSSSFWSILKEKPDFNFFKKIPDDLLRINNYEMISRAVRENNSEFDNIVKSKICLNYQNPCTNEEPFIEAISKPAAMDVVRALYPHIDAHACSFRGENAIHAAAKKGNLEALTFLYEKGIDYKKKNYDGHSPIFLSVFNGHFQFANQLVAYGQSVNALDKEGNTILMAAVDQCSVFHLNESYDYLIKLGMPVDAVNEDKRNIFHILFESKNFEQFADIAVMFYNNGLSYIKSDLQDSWCYKESIIFTEMANFVQKIISRYKHLIHKKDIYGVSPFEFLKENFDKKMVYLIENSFTRPI